MIRCYITDRRTLTNGEALLDSIARNLQAGPDWIQVREKDLSARNLYELVVAVLALPNPRGVKILVNTRVDVAIAAGASGAHLPSGSPAPHQWRSIVPNDFLIGVSCHTLEEVKRADEEKADYALYGPVFDPISKNSTLPAVGLQALSEATHAVSIPILALGGVNSQNETECIGAGAKGIAGISLFQR